tara:strand:- start:258 stop:548 length:291 start_codon:yes stop_codon:yes gene_type:complete
MIKDGDRLYDKYRGYVLERTLIDDDEGFEKNRFVIKLDGGAWSEEVYVIPGHSYETKGVVEEFMIWVDAVLYKQGTSYEQEQIETALSLQQETDSD